MRQRKLDPIDLVNETVLEDFIEQFMPQSDWETWTHPITNILYKLELRTPSTLSAVEFDTCFELIEATSAADYKNSKGGWKPRSKRKEMKLLDLKYILVTDEAGVQGFLSFMPTYEDDYPVIYCYEVHLSSELQGTGLGSVLMTHLHAIAARVHSAEKVMLTCFTINERAVKFYSKLGYEKDMFTPQPKVLRNGTRVESDYLIFSKDIVR